jgi:hypothetical protein
MKGQESNWPKVWNRPDLVACMWHVTYCWKAFNNGYNFASNFISIEVFHKNIWASKVVTVPISRISGLPRQNDIWVLALWSSIDNSIKGKVVASPKFGSW